MVAFPSGVFMSVLAVIRRNSEPIAVERRISSPIVDGFQQEAAPTTFNVQAHIQQAQRKDLANLPEGQRTQDWRVLWTETEMITADRVTEAGIEYVVQSVEHWKQGPFFKALMTEVDDEIP